MMAQKLDYAELIKGWFLAGKYGITRIDVTDYGFTIGVFDSVEAILHVPHHAVEIHMQGNGGADCIAKFRGPYMWRNCYRFIKAAHKHL